MLIDLSRRPFVILPDACPRHVVVRTMHTSTTNGYVVGRTVKDVPETLRAGASLTRNQQTLLETRLIPQRPDPTHVIEAFQLYRTSRSTEPFVAPRVFLPDPYEVPSAFRDTLTGRTGAWRHVIQMEHRRSGTWLVTLGLLGQELSFGVALRDLEIGPSDKTCVYELQRHIQKVSREGEGPAPTVWEKLTDTEE